MVLPSLDAWLRRLMPFRATKATRKRSHALSRGRLALEALEERCLLDSRPVTLPDQHLQFSLVDKTADWTVAGTVYTTTGEVAISTTDNSGQSLLLIEKGVVIDTTNVGPSFKLPASPSTPNYLDYFPSGSLTKLARLWQFTAPYTFNKASGLNSLVATDPKAPPQLVTVGGPSVIPYDQDGGLKITNLGVGSTLAPTALYITPGSNNLQTPSALNLSGRVTINALGSKLAKWADHLNVSIGDDATYVVRSDSVGLVQMVSKTGHGIWLDVNIGNDQLTGTINGVQIHWVRLGFSFDQTTKVFSLAGQWSVSLKDDAPDQTPFLVSLGDASSPGLSFNFATLTLEHFQASFVAGTSGGQYRGTFGPSGTAISIQGLYLMYDAATDSVGIGGQAGMGFGAKNDKGQFLNNLTVVLGNVAADQAGMFIQNGRVVKFNGTFIGQNLTIGHLGYTASGKLTVGYLAGGNGQPGVVSIAGTLVAGLPGGYSVGVILPGQGLVIKSNGDWDVAGGFGFSISGSAGAKGLSFRFNNLQMVYTQEPKAGGGTDDVWHITGGASLDTFFQASVNLTGNGLIIRNGDWDLEGITVYVGNLTAGGYGIDHLSFTYQKDASGNFEVKGDGRIALGIVQIGIFVDIKNGHLNSIGANFKAIGADPGLPVGDTGLFLTGVGFEVDNLDNLSQWAIQGNVSVAYGEGIQFEGQTVRLFTAEGHFKADSSEFVIDQADFQVMNGMIASGSGSLNLNWVTHQYHVHFDVAGFEGVLGVHADFNLNQFSQVSVYASVDVNIPTWVPFIGGDTLGSVEGYLYIDPVQPSNDLLAAWIDINTYIFGHFRVGAEFLFYPPPGQDRLQFLFGSDVEALEQQAVSHPDGYHTTFTPTVTASGTATPNQSLFALEWDNANAIGDVKITIPGVSAPVTIPQGAWGAPTPAPVPFTYNGNAYVVQPVKQLAGGQRISWVVGPDTSKNPGNAFLPLPTGQYTVDFVTAETLNGKLTHAEAFAPPTVTGVTLKQPPNSNQVEIDTAYMAADPAATRVDLYYTTNPAGGTGTFIKSIPLDATSPNIGTVSTTWDITDLVWNQPYYVIARISDEAKDFNGNTTMRTSAPVVSATSVSPYADLIVQLKLTPAVPVDQQSTTLAAWPVVWQQLSSDGTTVLQTVRGFTDGFGKAALTAARAGTNWTVVVAPKNWEGFQPLPDPAQGQSADVNGQLTTIHLSGGSYASPRIVTVAYQNEVSVQGQIALDLDSSRNLLTGGAGLSGEMVYLDQNNNGQWDPGEPRTATDLGGYYDLRFPLSGNTQPTNYTIRLMPDPSTVNTFVRTNPDSTSDVSFRAGSSYTVSVDASQPNPREVFADRDMLIQQPFLISGTAYVSGPSGQAYGPGATPVTGATINLSDANGHSLGSTTTAADGTYQFVLPGPGRYTVTPAPAAGQVIIPAAHQLQIDDATNGPLPLTLTTPQGAPLYRLPDQVAYTIKPIAPVVSGDFFGNGLWDTATLGTTNAAGRGNGDLYLTIIKGAASREQITTQSALILPNVDLAFSQGDPDLLWSPSLKRFVLTFGRLPLKDGSIARTYDPVTGKVQSVPFPANATGMNQLMGVTSSAAGGVTWLLSDANGGTSNWMLVRYSDYASAPQILASFNFYTGNGVKPLGPSAGLSWTAMVQGDVDGDGTDDYAFAARDAKNNFVVAYVLSREHFAQVHTTSLGGSFYPPISLHLVHVSRDASVPPWLAADMRSLHMLLYSARPATAAQVAAGAAATSFTFESVFDLKGNWPPETTFAGDDYLADVNGDGLQDLVLFAKGNTLSQMGVLVLLNQGDGRFTLAPALTVNGLPANPDNGKFSGVGGLLSVGAGVPPSFLGIGTYAYLGKTFPLDTFGLATNTSFVKTSYVAEVNSPGAYGGYDFGFSSGTATPGQAVSGVAYVDANGNGRQDPGEPSLANQQVQVTLVDARGNVTNQVVTTDSAGRYTITGANLTVLSVNGLSPANSQPASSPPAFPPALDPAALLPFSVPAYAVPAGTVGVQQFEGALGMDFNVNKPVAVTSLGVFDSGQDGLQRTLTAILYDRSTHTALATLTFTPDDPGTLVGGSRYKLLANPLLLPAGFQGTIVAEGYGPGEPNGNSNMQQPTWTTDPGNDNALAFVGTSRNGPAGAFPTNLDRFANNYAAGTFQFQPATVGGQGTPVGGGNLIQTLDYADSFTLGAGSRTGLAPNGQPTGDQLNVEYHSPQAPQQAWTTLGQISTDAAAVGVPSLAYPGRSNAGSEQGIVQAPGFTMPGIRYGLRDQYVVQVDLVQTKGGAVVSSGELPGGLYDSQSLTVIFFADDNAVGVTIGNRLAGNVTVYDSADGNPDLPGQAQPLRTGTKVDAWNNYAVAFDRLNQQVSLYVNGQLLKTLDLKVFANGQLANFSNAAVTVGSLGPTLNDPQVVWMDNFQVGAPYDGYQLGAAATNQTGYDFGVQAAATATGRIQGTVVLAASAGAPFAPGLPPVAGVTVYLDLAGDYALQPGDPQTVTDARGNFVFTGLKPGNYVVREDVPVGTVLAVREPDGTINYHANQIAVDVLGGQTAYANNFSNNPSPSSLGARFSPDVTPDYVRLVPRSADTTEVQIDIMSAASVGRTQVVGTFNPRDWRPVGVGDFNGDGQTDLLFQNQRDGSLQYWALINGELQSVQSLGAVPPDWQVRATADLSGTGITDLILRNIQTGELQAWLLDASGGKTIVSLGTLSLDWVVEGVADVNGDGKPDLLLHNLSSGAAQAWLLDGTTLLGRKDLGSIDPTYHLVGSQAWSPSTAAGTYLYWQQEGTNQVTRWDLDYQKGLVSTTPNFDLGRTVHAGRYLDSQPANELSPDYQLVRGLYQTVLGRAAESAGLQYWAQLLRTGTSRAQVTEEIWESAEHRGLEVDQFYATYLHRAADAFGRAFWVNELLGGMSESQVAEGFLTSAEYQQAHAGTTAYLFGLYADVLGRTPDPAGLDYWQAAAHSGLSPAQIADGFLGSAEEQQRLVAGCYANYLGRSGEASGVQYWLDALQAHQLSPAQVAQAFLASDEFFSRNG
jgi:hypothetical protein